MGKIICGDALTELRKLPDESIHMCVTSPPYWGLRDYGTAKWEGGKGECDHLKPALGGHGERSPIASTRPSIISKMTTVQYSNLCAKCGARRIDSQLGLEPTPEAYVAKLVEIFREVRRVLRKDGTLWLVIGDSYNAGRNGGWPGGKKQWKDKRYLNRSGPNVYNLKPKDLVGIPWRVAFALQADGWYLRSDIIWAKPNPMPESVTDRPTKSHEYIFLLSKSARYYFDQEAIAEPITDSTIQRLNQSNLENQVGSNRVPFKTNGPMKAVGKIRLRPNGAATYEKFGFDTGCGVREDGKRNCRSVWTITTKPFKEAHFATFPPEIPERCIKAGCPVGGVVLDPFLGSGTTGMVALKLGRDFIGIELNPKYCEMAKKRIYGELITGY